MTDSDIGIEFGGPFGAEAVGHFAEDDAGLQRSLGHVVGGRESATGEEDEEILPIL
ncbi:MAG TPA: hypothetical protein VJ770_07720 [Stellaceae bacterium]|nr:hypothetical protein [Stellaceae bacterium]